MLQIITGKFFQTEHIFTTLHRGTLYTNYQAISQDSPFETQIGRILPSTFRSGLGTITYELVEKIEGVPAPGVMTSTGGEEIVQDFAATFSFVFNVICTTDPDVCRNLTFPRSQEPGSASDSSRFLPSVFDRRIFSKQNDPKELADFLENLLGLPRSSYEATIRAIRQYSAALQDVGREPTLAYSLLVTSVESLSQSVDVPDATWVEYDVKKREAIDDVLQQISPNLAEELRAAILAGEHVAIARRFREFTKARIDPEFYRGEAVGTMHPVTQQDLDLLLRDAYSIRSSYVHRLEELKGLAAEPHGHSEVLYLDVKPTLTFAGLARIVRHVIRQFVLQTTKVERETHNWYSDLPNVIRLPVSPTHWLWNPEGYNGSTATMWLEAFLAQLSEAVASPSYRLTDLSKILDKIETMNIDGLKPAERRAVLTLYYLFIQQTAMQRDPRPSLLQRLEDDIQSPTIEGLAICLLRKMELPWPLQETEKLHQTYFQTRRQRGSLRLGSMLETIFTLRLAEMFRTQGQEGRARRLIAFAVENVPGDSKMLAFEEAHAASPLQKIDAYSVAKANKQPETQAIG